MAARLAPEVRFHSPITHTELHGPDAVVTLFAAIVEVLADVRYEELSGPGNTDVVHAFGTLDGQVVESVHLMRTGGDGRIVDFTVLVRPLPAVAALAEALGVHLARRQGRFRALVVRVLTRPLTVMTRVGDRIGLRLVGMGDS